MVSYRRSVLCRSGYIIIIDIISIRGLFSFIILLCLNLNPKVCLLSLQIVELRDIICKS